MSYWYDECDLLLLLHWLHEFSVTWLCDRVWWQHQGCCWLEQSVWRSPTLRPTRKASLISTMSCPLCARTGDWRKSAPTLLATSVTDLVRCVACLVPFLVFIIYWLSFVVVVVFFKQNSFYLFLIHMNIIWIYVMSCVHSASQLAGWPSLISITLTLDIAGKLFNPIF